MVFYEWNWIASKPPVEAESELSSWKRTGREEKGMPIPDDFQQLLQQERMANEHFLAGDAGPVKMQWSHADDVTICGGLGAYEKGWEQVGPRLDWAAAPFRAGHSTIEMLAMGTSGDLAYAVWIDRGQVRVAGRDEFSPMVLRITQIYRREEGMWKVIHRHGDPITGKTEVSAILQQEGSRDKQL